MRQVVTGFTRDGMVNHKPPDAALAAWNMALVGSSVLTPSLQLHRVTWRLCVGAMSMADATQTLYVTEGGVPAAAVRAGPSLAASGGGAELTRKQRDGHKFVLVVFRFLAGFFCWISHCTWEGKVRKVSHWETLVRE